MVFDLHGKKGLVVGIANDQSIAWGCARAFRAAGLTIVQKLDADSYYVKNVEI